MSGPTRSPRSGREGDGETVVDGDPLRSLSDVARNPLRRPLATAVAALVVCTLGYQSYVVAVAAGPVVGVLAVAAVAVAYGVAKRLWAVQHRFMTAELDAAGELDRLR